MSAVGLPEILVVILAILVVIVLLVRHGSRPTSMTPSNHQPPAEVRLSQDTVQAVTSLLQEKRKIQAIKIVRAETNLGLKEAKDLVDRWEPSLLHVTPVIPETQGAPAVPQADILAIEARAIAKASGKILAIKYVRQQTGWGLAEAKTFVEGA